MATAVVSDPPLPKVVMSPSSLIPLKSGKYNYFSFFQELLRALRIDLLDPGFGMMIRSDEPGLKSCH